MSINLYKGVSNDVSDDIHRATLYEKRHILLHGYVWPFIILYAVWAHFLINVYGIENSSEIWLIISIVCIILSQILACLFCHWFIGLRSFLNYSKVCAI